MDGTPNPQDLPPMPPAQDQRFRELTRDYEGVALTPLAGGLLILACRDAAGDVAHLEVVDRDGQALPAAEVTRALGTARQHAYALGDRVTDHLVEHLRLRSDAGDDLNISQIARDTGVARQTLYTRLADK